MKNLLFHIQYAIVSLKYWCKTQKGDFTLQLRINQYIIIKKKKKKKKLLNIGDKAVYKIQNKVMMFNIVQIDFLKNHALLWVNNYLLISILNKQELTVKEQIVIEQAVMEVNKKFLFYIQNFSENRVKGINSDYLNIIK